LPSLQRGICDRRRKIIDASHIKAKDFLCFYFSFILFQRDTESTGLQVAV